MRILLDVKNKPWANKYPFADRDNRVYLVRAFSPHLSLLRYFPQTSDTLDRLYEIVGEWLIKRRGDTNNINW